MYLYLLKSENGRYYIHESSEPDLDLKYFKNKKDIEFLKYFKPVEIIEIAAGEDVGPTMLELMKDYGIDNVRGTGYTKLNLTDRQRRGFEDKLG